jgi:hypothetical protein
MKRMSSALILVALVVNATVTVPAVTFANGYAELIGGVGVLHVTPNYVDVDPLLPLRATSYTVSLDGCAMNQDSVVVHFSGTVNDSTITNIDQSPGWQNIKFRDNCLVALTANLWADGHIGSIDVLLVTMDPKLRLSR